LAQEFSHTALTLVGSEFTPLMHKDNITRGNEKPPSMHVGNLAAIHAEERCS